MPQRFARWMPKLSLCQTASRISKAADRFLLSTVTAWLKAVPFQSKFKLTSSVVIACFHDRREPKRSESR
jgi:hypothetical protein